MFITKLSPSAISKFDDCQIKYFIEYVLNFRSEAGISAGLGTCFHSIMEVLSRAKLHSQKTQEQKFILEHKTLGKYEFNTEKWNKVDEFKLGRTTYKIFDKDSVDDIFNLIYTYYVNFNAKQEWNDENRKSVQKWVYTYLDYQDRKYDVRHMEIIEPEQYLSLCVENKWGEYHYADGISGNLKLNGIIDLVRKVGNEHYEIIDYKTGNRKCWITNKIKDIEYLKNDIQLQFYYYLLTQLLPQYKYITLTIFFVKDGGPFSIHFEKSDIKKIEGKIQKYFEEIKNCSVPKPLSQWQSHFRCRYCEHSKAELDGTNRCKAVINRIKLSGIEKVTEELRQK